MPANTYIPDHYPTEFATNWEHLLQQKISKLKQYVTVDVINGKEKTYNQLSSTTMRLITTRSANTSAQNTATAKRWIRQSGYDAVDLFDEFDDQLLGNVVLPTSEVVMNHAMAYGRTCDQILITALGGTAYTGATGTTATTLPVAQKILANWTGTQSLGGSGWGADSGTVGLNLAKLIKAKSILRKAEVEDEMLMLTVTQQQIDDLLLNVTEVKSSDYANVKALVAGEVDTFMGFKFIRTEQHAAVSSNFRRIYAYAKSGVILADAGRKVHIDVRADLNHSLQIRSVASLGATRREEQKVVEIGCYEA